jgi:anti-anti-sigma regulatory factor
MRSEALDIAIEGRGSSTWLTLSGPFHKEQVPNIRGKFTALLEDGNRLFTVDLEGVTVIDSPVAEMFLTILNEVRGKGGEIRFIFRNPAVSAAFAPYERLFLIYPDASSLGNRGFFGRVFSRGSILSKKTGVRISRPVALFLIFVLCGWFLSLVFILHIQGQRIAEQEKELAELKLANQRSAMELGRLKDRMRPLEQLGVLRDSLKEQP